MKGNRTYEIMRMQLRPQGIDWYKLRNGRTEEKGGINRHKLCLRMSS